MSGKRWPSMVVIVGAVTASGFLSQEVGRLVRPHLNPDGGYMKMGIDKFDKKLMIRDLEHIAEEAFDKRRVAKETGTKEKTTFFEKALMSHHEGKLERKFRKPSWLASWFVDADAEESHYY